MNSIIDKVFHISLEEHAPALKGLTAKWREQAGDALERFIARSGEFAPATFGEWGSAKTCSNLARWCSSRFGKSPALRFFMMRVLSVPFSSSAAERNYSVWNAVWTHANSNMTFDNAAGRVFMFCNQRTDDSIAVEAFSADHFLHCLAE